MYDGRSGLFLTLEMTLILLSDMRPLSASIGITQAFISFQ